MSKILILGAGGPAGVNTCRALHAAGHDIIAADDNFGHLIWCEPYTEELRAIPAIDQIDDLKCDFVMAQPDVLALRLADAVAGEKVYTPTFLPDRRTIVLCQDKWESGLAFRRAKLRKDFSYLVQGAPDLLKFNTPHWVRARHGAGARGSFLAANEYRAEQWINLWLSIDRTLDFLIEEYLPGRDLAWSSIWYHGKLITSFLRERLEYIYPHLTMTGLTGTPTIARIVHDEVANSVAYAAVQAVDDRPHGIFSVDMREDSDGVPRPTEINAGRGFTTFGLWSLFDESRNFMADTVELTLMGLISGLDYPAFDALPQGLTLSRHIDCQAAFTFAGSVQYA